MSFTQIEIDSLRALATEYMSYATLPIQKQKIDMWKSLNRSKMQRPMVTIEQLPTNELNNNGDLDCVCQDKYWKNVEFSLRLLVYKWKNFPVDMVLDPYITVPKVVTNSKYGIDLDQDTTSTDKDNDVVSHDYHNQIEEMEDIEKIKDMVITYDVEKTKERLQEAHFLFDGYAPVRIGGGVGFHLGVWDYLSMLMGVENVYFEMMDRPELLLGAMDKLTHSVLAGIEQANKLLCIDDTTSICHCSHIFTDKYLPDCGESLGSNSKNCWAFGMAQLLTSCSRDAFLEYEFPFISKMAEQFGNIYYGCCEKLDDRLDLIKKIPNVRKVSCSPWSNKRHFAENIGQTLIMSNKPNPAFVALDCVDEDVIRKDLEETMQCAKDNNVNLEFLFKDLSTVKHHPENLRIWNKIAMEVVEKW